MTGIMHMFKCGGFVIKLLRCSHWAGYISSVAPQWATGICTPSMLSATTDAPCVFFYVAINATERHFMAWCYVSRTGLNRSFLHLSLHYAALSMVAQAGQLSGWPVSDNAGSANPVWAIAIMKICTFGDSIDYAVIGGCLMASILTQNNPQYTWLFLAVRRADLQDKPHRKQITAPDYPTARRLIAREYVAAYAGRLPLIQH
ncbi:host cell division inhibitor Icd-like protein [Pseudocitrobacter sp. 2023EL-00150]|uniref:host cell division inhibitor Icd-like protein n=1 Tax=Pseudocitrobacter sp. 2023EL-00150 TaxID=3032322 RepID=UPI0023E3E2EE|nr:host cell division inhibitor Icd-like protein [Pseudocitrobacter sp. 2023EL-00150]MDF3828322.1 host cell division inhibitor Icd-like protein [Pseudocitrobacter sp. 2023EL-00150]